MRNTAELDTKHSNAGFRDGFTYFLIGSGIGAVVALLFAPKSGSELRGEIAEVSRKGYDATKEKAIGLKDQSAEVLQSVREKADKVYDFAAGKLKNGEAAVDKALDMGSEAVADGVDEVRDEAANIVNKPASGRRASSIM